MKCPKAGEGVNAYINNRVNYYIRVKHTPPDVIRKILKIKCQDCGRDVTQDIDHAIETIQNHLNLQLTDVNKIKWPSLNRPLLYTLGLTKIVSIEWWKEQSQQGDASDEEILEYMMSPGDLVCIAVSKTEFCTYPLKEILVKTKLKDWQYIVPNPMSKMWGKTKSGKDSMRSLNNVANRRYVVIEFDSGTLNEQCQRHKYLSQSMELRLLVYSGNKSIHGWYKTWDFDEDESLIFMKRAVAIGADPMLWVPVQLTRCPGGTNRNTNKKQEIIYWKG